MAIRDQCVICGCLLEPHEIQEGECDHCLEEEDDMDLYDGNFSDDY